MLGNRDYSRVPQSHSVTFAAGLEGKIVLFAETEIGDIHTPFRIEMLVRKYTHFEIKFLRNNNYEIAMHPKSDFYKRITFGFGEIKIRY